ncbi:diguanylate cyclase (GGDEF)-like protein [Acetoanaerobium pronyense]|uniref:Diguanylate cyclase (GGDEF)-like protein n=1 Tax=Acetoanaerobium pronyense TaxID=1482736 RepID=A0ABS4KLH2_9FIRM|nr:EAL domain-containing protein [Acetoanaerobium pronyense]MBP2028637.1 diguanylate cyclase (GGDEF)-like protein [Acetoanaerobium pronyense]
MIKYYKSKVVSLMRLFYIPLILTIAIILIISGVSIYFNHKVLQSQYKEEGILIASQIGEELSRNIQSQEYAEYVLENKIRVAALTILELQEMNDIDNETLYRMLEVLDVSELHYMDKDGEILFSTIEGYIGWTPSATHPLYEFVRSDDTEIMEVIRPDDKYQRPIKYGAVKGNDGSFVQVGINAEIVALAKEQFSFQKTITSLTKNPQILEAKYLDLNLNIIAQSDRYEQNKSIDINADFFNSKNDVLIEKKVFQNTGLDAYDYYIPVYYGDSFSGILNITFSFEDFAYFNKLALIIYFFLILFLVSSLIWFQFQNIVVPICELEESIRKIDVSKNLLYMLPKQKTDTFGGITSIINKILENTYLFIFELHETKDELENSNEELSAAYQQIQASEEILKTQYDEILNQKNHIEFIAFNDPLTGLLNRQGFTNLVKERLAKDKKGAILLIGIDNFKGINNTLGHSFGDIVLGKISEILKENKDSNILVSRFSGDEFIVYISEFSDFLYIENYVLNISGKLRENLNADGKRVYITTSIGISIYPNDSSEINRLIMNADSAMYKVKEKGKNGYLYFNEDMIKALNEKAKIEILLREAIRENNFKLVYQPQISLITGKTVGFEALLRMKNNEYSPDVFIPVAEELGTIVAIGRWVANEVIKQIASWQKDGLDVKPVAINFSPRQLNDRGFHKYLKDLLLEYNVSTDFIEIEVTENILIDNIDEALNYLNKFKELNISMALDDFGTGFSSINYLSSLPISKVKLDKSVIWRYLKENKEDVIKTIIQLSNCFDLTLVAEGIEDKSTAQILKHCGCEIVQGYYYSKPVDSETVKEMIDKTYS